MAHTIVYLVTSGSYSDYAIDGAFSTRELAQAYIDKAKGICQADGSYDVGNVYWASDAGIEEWPLDKESDAKQFTFWTVGMMADDGSVIEAVRSSQEFGHPESLVTQLAVPVPMYNNRLIIRVRSVKSGDHALKLAAEARQRWLRERG